MWRITLLFWCLTNEKFYSPKFDLKYSVYEFRSKIYEFRHNIKWLLKYGNIYQKRGITEIGSHEELSEGHPLYQRFIEQQSY